MSFTHSVHSAKNIPLMSDAVTDYTIFTHHSHNNLICVPAVNNIYRPTDYTQYMAGRARIPTYYHLDAFPR